MMQWFVFPSNKLPNKAPTEFCYIPNGMIVVHIAIAIALHCIAIAIALPLHCDFTKAACPMV